MRWRPGLALLLAACATAESVVRKAAARDFECSAAEISVESRSATLDAGDGYPHPRQAFIARGCGLTVVYGVGGEWLSSWATPCATVTVRGRRVASDPFASATAEGLCADTIADAGAIAPEPAVTAPP